MWLQAQSARRALLSGVCTKNRRYGRTIEIGQNDTALRRHRDWMKTEEAKQAYLRRLPLIEPLFAILRNQLGARQFALRGLPNVKAEWSMFATPYNLRTLWRVWRSRLDTRVNAMLSILWSVSIRLGKSVTL